MGDFIYSGNLRATGDLYIGPSANDPVLTITTKPYTNGVTSENVNLLTCGGKGIILPKSDNANAQGWEADGMIRYNNSSGEFQGYGTGGWTTLASTASGEQYKQITGGNQYNKIQVNNTTGNMEFYVNDSSNDTRRMMITPDGNIGINIEITDVTRGYSQAGISSKPLVTLDIVGTDGIIIPSGNISERPFLLTLNGAIRYNTDTDNFEGCTYTNNDDGVPTLYWRNLNVSNPTNTTRINATSELEFFTNDTSRLKIDNSGILYLKNLDTSNPNYSLETISDNFYMWSKIDNTKIETNFHSHIFKFHTSNLTGTPQLTIDSATINLDSTTINLTGDVTLNNSIYIKNDGKVGIGTNAPQNKLDVEGGVVIGASYSGSSDTLAPSNGLLVEGNVGIGTTSPTAPLQVSAITNTDHNKPDKNAISIFQSDTDKDAIMSIRVQSQSVDNPAGTGNPFVSFDLADRYGWSIGVDHSDDEKFKICNNWNFDTASEQLTIDKTGNVDVNGSISAGYNSNTTSYFGKAVVGTTSGLSNFARFSHKDLGDSDYSLIHEYNGNTFLNASSGKQIGFRIANSQKMTLSSGGSVGIGTTNPGDILQIVGDVGHNIDNTHAPGSNNYSQVQILSASIASTNGNKMGLCLGADHKTYTGFIQTIEKNTHKRSLSLQPAGGFVGIGTVSPGYPLHVTKGSAPTGTDFSSTNSRYLSYNSATATVGSINWNDKGHQFSIYAEYGIHSETYTSASDSRIKDNIEDVPDDLALQQIRDIPCRYYTYKDIVHKGTARTIGFIAQEVKEVIPEAVSQISEYIQDEYRLLTEENKNWTSVNNDGSDIKYNLTISDLSPSENSTYRFIVGDNDVDEETTLEIKVNEDGSFTFEKQWNYVFLYGSLVDDFNVLDKQKIFAIHHAGIQELDRIQKAHATEIQTLKDENTTLKSQIQDLLNRVSALENN